MHFESPPVDNSHVVVEAAEYNRLLSIAQLFNESQNQTPQTAQTPQPPVSCLHANTPCQTPDLFDGSRQKSKIFISQLKIYFLAKSFQFINENSKIYFACSLLRGEAFSWFQTFMDSPSFPSCFPNFNSFSQALLSQFGDANSVEIAEKSLLSISQQTSVADYASKFKILSAQIKWNDSALICHFYRGLKDRVKDELTKYDRPATLNELIDLCIKLDHRLTNASLKKSLLIYLTATMITQSFLNQHSINNPSLKPSATLPRWRLID